jgi:murein DD-endopeptidase MepM/ murein hydrolase activator NlpD
LKRAFTQKVNLTPSCETNNDALAQLSAGKLFGEVADCHKSVSPEATRRVRTSAAMIGLAISMGASSLLLPQQGDEAMAATEPTAAEPTFTATAPATVAIALSSTVKPEVAHTQNLALLSPAVATAKIAPHAIQHQVEAGQTLWNLSHTYRVEAAAIAASNDFKPTTILTPGEVLKVPAVNGIAYQVKPGDTVENLSKSHGVAPAQLEQFAPKTAFGQLPVGETVTIPGNVNQLLKARQDIALNRLQEKTNSLQTNLAEFRVKKSAPPSVEIAVTAPAANRLPQVAEAQMPQVVQLPTFPATTNLPPAVPSVAIAPLAAPVAKFNLNTGKLQIAEVSPSVLAPSPVNPAVYQVKSGDTLDAIAQNYGVTRTDLAKANNITDPNLIKVNQELKIPEAVANNIPTPKAIASVQVNLQTATNSEQPTQSKAAPTLLTPVPAPVAESFAPVPQAIEQNVKPSTTVGQKAIATPTVLVAAEPNQAENKEYNPYVEKLRVEVLKMREQYRNQQSVANSNPTVPQVSLPSTPAPAAKIPTSAELTGNRPPAATAKPVASPLAAPTISPIKVPSLTISLPETRPTQQRQIVASAPAEAANYNPMIQSPVGRTVAPELPSLPGPNPYLPNSPQQFNGYIWPTKGELTSGYGWRWGKMHRGIDIAAAVGTPVVAAAPGVVVGAGWNSGGYGNLVEIQHPDGSITRYAHNNRILVREGQVVEQGQQISEMGSTGYSTGPHCHFEVHPAGKGAVNPMAFLPGR